MNVTIISVGRLKEKYLKDAIEEYVKRISRFTKINIIEVQDEKAPENLSDKQMEQVKDKEGEKILKHIKDGGYIVSLVIKGKMFTSEKLAEFMDDRIFNGTKQIYFVIGGSLGLSTYVIQKSNLKLSFSEMTFPHQLMRLILLEQIFRTYKINLNQPYHK